MAKRLKLKHPGEVLREEFLAPLKMSAGALARACGLPRTRIERIASAIERRLRTRMRLPRARRSSRGRAAQRPCARCARS